MLNTVLIIVSLTAIGISVVVCLICFACFSKYAKQTLRDLDKIIQGNPCNYAGRPKEEFQLSLYSVTKNAVRTVLEQENKKRGPLEIKVTLEDLRYSSKVKDEPNNGLEVPEFMERPYGTDL